MEPLLQPATSPLGRMPAVPQTELQGAGIGASRVPKIGERFNDVLNRVKVSSGESPEESRRKEAEKVAGDLVSQALILPILKQLRRTKWSENPVFGGGLAEKTFGPEFDIHLADRIAHSPQLGVTQALADRMLHRGAIDRRANKPTGQRADLNG